MAKQVGIRFLKHKVTFGSKAEGNLIEVKCYYWHFTHVDGKHGVHICAKEYGRELSKIFSGVRNETDTMTDYFEKDTLAIYPGQQYYEEVKQMADMIAAERAAKYEARMAKYQR